MSVQADQQAAALQQRLASDPAFKAQVAELAGQIHAIQAQIQRSHRPSADQLIQLRDAGVKLNQLTGLSFTPGQGDLLNSGAPQGWMFDAQGNLSRDHRTRNDWLRVAAVVGGGVAAGAIGGAAAGGAAGGGATGGGTAAAGGGSTAVTPAVTTAATGSTLDQIMKYAKAAGPVLSAVETGRAAGRSADAQAGRDDQQAVIDAINAGNNQRRSLGDEYQRNISNALRGNALKNIKDVSFTPPPGVTMGTITGGLRPSILGGADVGDPIHTAAMKYLLNPEQPRDIPIPTTPRAGASDTALNWLAPILTGVGAYRSLTGSPAALPPPNPDGSTNLVTRYNVKPLDPRQPTFGPY